jgi:hypothetical protein
MQSIGQADQCTTVAEKSLNTAGLNNGEQNSPGRYDARTEEEIIETNFLPATK